MPLDIRTGDILETKKSHPCGGNKFEVQRAGMDFRIRCMKCDKQIWIDRPDLEKRIKKVERAGEILSRDDVKKTVDKTQNK